MHPTRNHHIINYTLPCNGTILTLTTPIIMGIVNVTPDSFYTKSRMQTADAVLTQAAQMVAQGATIIDVGAQSTRPNSEQLSWQVEWQRLQHILPLLRTHLPKTILSIDTYYSQIVQRAATCGVDVINDISGGNFDAQMHQTVARLKLGYIAMHIQGTPRTMQLNPTYTNVVSEVTSILLQKKEQCNQAGIQHLLLDVGFGFGKTIAHNYELLTSLNYITKALQVRLLAGLSRKGMIYNTLNITASESLNGTTVLHTIAIQQGVAVLRVHDVVEAAQVIKLMEVMYKY